MAKFEPVHCRACGTLSFTGRCDCTRADIRDTPNGPYKDPTCPKCGILLANKMAYVCQHSYCPSGLN